MTVTDDLAIKLSDLWYGERCAWTMDFDSGAGSTEPWIVTLEWTQEHGNAHHADWMTYYWTFYGATITDALTDAVRWCEGLVPFERCGACGGERVYNRTATADGLMVCEECDGSGLAHREMSATGTGG